MPSNECASNLGPLEYGAGYGFISHIEGKNVVPPYVAKAMERGPERRQLIQGYALVWKSIIRQNSKLYWFAPGSIKSPMTGEPKLALFNHYPGEVIATTRDGLSFRIDDYGLAMRLEIDGSSVRQKAYLGVKSGERTALSVGVVMHAPEPTNVDGETVHVVRSATLEEVSFVESGACAPAFCSLTNADTAGTLEQDLDSGRVMRDAAAGRVMKAGRDLVEALRR